MTAGTLPARRVRRAPPLPNSVRVSADSRTSDTAILLERSLVCSATSFQHGASDAGTRVDDRHRVDHGSARAVPRRATASLYRSAGGAAYAGHLRLPAVSESISRGMPHTWCSSDTH